MIKAYIAFSMVICSLFLIMTLTRKNGRKYKYTVLSSFIMSLTIGANIFLQSKVGYLQFLYAIMIFFPFYFSFKKLAKKNLQEKIVGNICYEKRAPFAFIEFPLGILFLLLYLVGSFISIQVEDKFYAVYSSGMLFAMSTTHILRYFHIRKLEKKLGTDIIENHDLMEGDVK